MTFPTNGFSVTLLGEHPTAITRILWGNSGYFVICSLQITPFFFLIEYVFFTILTYGCSYFNAIKIVNYHLKTCRTTTRRPRDFSCTPEYVNNGNLYFAHLVSFENDIY